MEFPLAMFLCMNRGFGFGPRLGFIVGLFDILSGLVFWSIAHGIMGRMGQFGKGSGLDSDLLEDYLHTL